MKINCPTSMTNPAAIAPLLDAISKNGYLNSVEARTIIFPKARAAVSRWNENNPDTHSEGHLGQYGLIEYKPGSNDEEFGLSFLGERFLELFEVTEEGKYKRKDGMEHSYNAVLIDCLLTWKLTVGGKTLHPGLLLLRLMIDPRLEEYIFESEWAYVCNSDFADNLDYDALVQELMDYRSARQEPPVESSGNTYAFLVAFSNSWKIFEKDVLDGKNKFALCEITRNNLKSKMEEIETLRVEDKGILSEGLRTDKYTEPVYVTEVRDEGFQRNRIVFGAPGTGKSFTINSERKQLLGEENESDYERVTFHPDYSYANFVGTYKPVPCKDSEGNTSITYEYVPGPFMRIYVKAIKNGKTEDVRPFLLIIEEINRANVAAVFGDVFQLLDRNADSISEYPIQVSEDMKKYLAKELGGRPEDYTKIKLPNNLFIWATMNSADQGVFPMDTAFKRRWNFTYIGINDNDEDLQGKMVVLGSDNAQRVEWNKLRKAINNFLAKQKINEDKQLGPYFISRNIVVPVGGNEIDKKAFDDTFKSKVIMYLFEDAAKQKRPSLFEGCFQNHCRYSEICAEYDRIGIGIFNHEIQLETSPEDITGPAAEIMRGV